jgi:hypothetical protein
LTRDIEKLNSEEVSIQETKTLNDKVTKALKDVFTDPLPVKLRKTLVSVNFGVVKISIETVREKNQ